MILINSPSFCESNDVYNILDQCASVLVLAAETAIGNNPIQCVNYLSKIIKIYKKYGKQIRY